MSGYEKCPDSTVDQLSMTSDQCGKAKATVNYKNAILLKQHQQRTYYVSDTEFTNMNKTQSVPSKTSNLGLCSPSHKNFLKVKRFVNREIWEILKI